MNLDPALEPSAEAVSDAMASDALHSPEPLKLVSTQGGGGPASSTPRASQKPRRTHPRVGWGEMSQEMRGVRNFYFRYLRMEHHLTQGGLLRRFVVIESQEWRCVLRQPRRREIDPLHTRQEAYELRTSELWEYASTEALECLEAIDASAQSELAKRQEAKPSRPGSAPAFGRVLQPVACSQEARGILLHANADSLFVWDAETLQLLKIRGPGLEAIQAAQVRFGERVLVEPNGHESLAIDEERSGTHGTGRRTLRRTRSQLKVHRIDPVARIDAPPETRSPARRA